MLTRAVLCALCRPRVAQHEWHACRNYQVLERHLAAASSLTAAAAAWPPAATLVAAGALRPVHHGHPDAARRSLTHSKALRRAEAESPLPKAVDCHLLRYETIAVEGLPGQTVAARWKCTLASCCLWQARPHLASAATEALYPGQPHACIRLEEAQLNLHSCIGGLSLLLLLLLARAISAAGAAPRSQRKTANPRVQQQLSPGAWDAGLPAPLLGGERGRVRPVGVPLKAVRSNDGGSESSLQQA